MNRLINAFLILKSRVDEIQKYITNTIDNNTKLEKMYRIADEDAKDLVSYFMSLGSQTVHYNAIIISLYGCFENYVDELLSAYATILISKRQRYDDLPSRLKNKYRQKLGDFLANPQRYKGFELDELSVIENYHSILHSNFKGKIDDRLIIAHAGNLYAKDVFQLMQDLGIDDSRSKVFDSEIFKKFYIECIGKEEKEYIKLCSRDKQDSEHSLFLPLTELVSQRNTVAHGWKDENRLSSSYIYQTIVPFLLVFTQVLLLICLENIASIMESKDYLNLEPIRVINKCIFCFASANNQISNGDYVVFKKGKKFIAARVLRIEKDNNKIEHIENIENIEIGIQVDRNITQNSTLIMIININNS